MKRKDIIAAGLAAALVLGATLAPAAAYLTGTTRHGDGSRWAP